MEGPTPVSALIHAATMVTAGVYLVARTAPIFALSPIASDTVAVVGAATALFAATIAIAQNDIKRVLAYSTISQLGYMVMAVGVTAYTAGLFHLMTHAFFKALLFLAAGSVIHAMGDEQDMTRMGGLFRPMRVTAVTSAIAVLAIIGDPTHIRVLVEGRHPRRHLRTRWLVLRPLGGRSAHRRAHRLLHDQLVHPHLPG